MVNNQLSYENKNTAFFRIIRAQRKSVTCTIYSIPNKTFPAGTIVSSIGVVTHGMITAIMCSRCTFVDICNCAFPLHIRRYLKNSGKVIRLETTCNLAG